MADAPQRPTQSDVAGSGPAPGLGLLHIGTAGFSCAHWADHFYPRAARSSTDMMLDCYQEKLTSVEMNATFYGTPTSSTVRNWRAHSAKGFGMVWKVAKAVTHEGRMDSEAALAALRHFLGRAAELGKDGLAALLFQCPRTLRVDVPQLQAVHRAVQASGLECRVAVEVRHPDSARDPELLATLRAHCWALVVHPDSVGRATVRGQSDCQQAYKSLQPLRTDAVTAGFVYVRLHGGSDEHTYRYSDEELAPYAQQLHSWRCGGLDVYCFFLNDDDRAAMPQNAVRMRQLVHELAGEAVPRAPKQASSRSIASFFGPKPAAAAAGKPGGAEPVAKRAKTE